MIPDLSVLVLAGGQGRRLGGHKPTRRVGLARLVDHPLALARRLSDDVLLLAGPRAVDAPGDVRRVPDHPTIPGPLGGLAAGLEAARHGWCLLLPCDMPFYGAAAPAHLAAAAARAPTATEVVALATGGRPQPFGALWHRRVLPRLLRHAARGRHGLTGLLAASRGVVLDVAVSGEDHRAFHDVDEPADLARLPSDPGPPPWAS